MRQVISVITMEKALKDQDNYDVFIIDEADACLMEKGSLIDHPNQKVRGYWDLMQRKTVLLTATIPFDLDDLL